jgi:hypothetical protein
MRRNPRTPKSLDGTPILAALLLAAATVTQASEPLAEPRWSPNERLQRERLSAVQASVDSLAARRHEVRRTDGLLDLRCNFHAHAGDSTHTGGTPEEILRAAKAVGVDVLFLSDHFRPPRDFMDGWRGLREGVLFIPGSECRGFLVSPERSVFQSMQEPIPKFVGTVNQGDGLIFLSHIEERPDHPMDGLTGLEIYNRHYDAKRDFTGILKLVLRLTDPDQVVELSDLLKRYPDACLAGQAAYPQAYLEKWDAATATGRFTGVAANDCHHNQVFLVKKLDDDTALIGTVVDKDEDMRKVKALLRPALRRLLEGHRPGDVVVRLDFDPYERSLRNVSTHVLAAEKTEPALRTAVKAGRVYVSHDWMADPTGFDFGGTDGLRMGDERPWAVGTVLKVESPLPARIRLMRDGRQVALEEGYSLRHETTGPGVYRVELWFDLGGELRPWLYSNPVYLRSAKGN